METTQNLPQLQIESEHSQTSKFSYLTILLGLLLLVVFGVSVFFYFQNQSLKKELVENLVATDAEMTIKTPTPVVALLTAFTNQYEFGPKVADEFNKIVQEFDGKVVVDTEDSVWWISNDNFNIINRNEVSLDYQNYQCETSPGDTEVVTAVARRLSEKLTPLMASFGFSLNQKNSSQSLVDDRFYDYVQAYEKGDVKCTFTVNPECGAYVRDDRMHNDFKFACTKSLNQNYQDQIPYLKGLNITQSVIRVTRKIGDFAFINVNYRRTGHFVIAKLINGKWTELYAGQDRPDCATMEQHQVPKEIYEECYTEEDLNEAEM